MSDNKNISKIDNDLLNNIKNIVVKSKQTIAQTINNQLINTYWLIGKEIVLSEKNNKLDNPTSRKIILELSKILTNEIGKGFSRSNLFNMRKFYLTYPNVQTVFGQLSWSHICELISIDDEDKRNFYEKETINSNWSVRELKRQLNSSLYERLLLSKGKSNKQDLLKLSEKGNEIASINDLIDVTDNPPIGLILCAEKDEITAEYILGGFENNVFASKYITVLPNKEKLIKEVEIVLNKTK